jgi:Cdc6-like AAA superfamily ATPase
MSVTLPLETIIDTMVSLPLETILLVDSAAGTGKTSTALAVVDALKPKKALYTAFNKAIIVEGSEKFTKNVECKTLHALALSYVRPKMKIEKFTYLCIKENLSYPDKKAVI